MLNTKYKVVIVLLSYEVRRPMAEVRSYQVTPVRY